MITRKTAGATAPFGCWPPSTGLKAASSYFPDSSGAMKRAIMYRHAPTSRRRTNVQRIRTGGRLSPPGKLGVCRLGRRRRLRCLGRFVLLQYFNEVPIRVSKRHDEPKAVVGRADGLNTIRGQALGNGPHTRRAKHHDRTLSISSRNAGEPFAGMDGEMHAADIAPVVKRDSRVFLIFQREAQGVPVEVR